MVEFDLHDAADMDNPYDFYSRIKVWSENQGVIKVISMYYNGEDAPEDFGKWDEWQRQKAMEYVSFDAVGARVEDEREYVDKGLGGRSYYE